MFPARKSWAHHKTATDSFHRVEQRSGTQSSEKARIGGSGRRNVEKGFGGVKLRLQRMGRWWQRVITACLGVRRLVAASRILIWIIPLCLAESAWGDATQEKQLKADALCNLAAFTSWPTNTFASSNTLLVIGIVGTDPFEPELEEAFKHDAPSNRDAIIQVGPDNITDCNILFISRSENSQLEKIVRELKGKPILTVSDIEDAAQRGAMVGFISDGSELRLKINTNALSASHLNVSSKLLRAVEVIPDAKLP
jgi:hypothetical protein